MPLTSGDLGPQPRDSNILEESVNGRAVVQGVATVLTRRGEAICSGPSPWVRCFVGALKSDTACTPVQSSLFIDLAAIASF